MFENICIRLWFICGLKPATIHSLAYSNQKPLAIFQLVYCSLFLCTFFFLFSSVFRCRLFVCRFYFSISLAFLLWIIQTTIRRVSVILPLQFIKSGGVFHFNFGKNAWNNYKWICDDLVKRKTLNHISLRRATNRQKIRKKRRRNRKKKRRKTVKSPTYVLNALFFNASILCFFCMYHVTTHSNNLPFALSRMTSNEQACGITCSFFFSFYFFIFWRSSNIRTQVIHNTMFVMRAMCCCDVL